MVRVGDVDPLGVTGRKLPKLLAGGTFAAPHSAHLSAIEPADGGMVLAELIGTVIRMIVKDKERPKLRVVVKDFGEVAMNLVAHEERGQEWFFGTHALQWCKDSVLSTGSR